MFSCPPPQCVASVPRLFTSLISAPREHIRDAIDASSVNENVTVSSVSHQCPVNKILELRAQTPANTFLPKRVRVIATPGDVTLEDVIKGEYYSVVSFVLEKKSTLYAQTHTHTHRLGAYAMCVCVYLRLAAGQIRAPRCRCRRCRRSNICNYNLFNGTLAHAHERNDDEYASLA